MSELPDVDPVELVANSDLEGRHRALVDVGAQLFRSSDAAQLYRAIHREAAKVMDFTGLMLSVYDPESDVATLVCNVVDGQETACGVTYKGSDSTVLRTGKPTTVVDHTDPGTLPFLGRGEPEAPECNDARSTLSVPIICGGRPTAALTVYQRGVDAYDADDLKLLERMATLAAVALDNVRRIEELQRCSREAERLEEIGRLLTSSLDFGEVLDRVSHAARDLLRVEGAGVWTHEDGCATVRTSIGEVPIPVGTTWTLSDSLDDTIVGQGKPFSVADAATDENVPDSIRPYFRTGSAISVPIVVAERVIGALSVRSRQMRRFSEHDIVMLVRLAGQASGALDNAQLHASMQALSLTDSLTGLPNRRHLQLHLEREFAAAERGRKLAVVIFDLDGFKHYNDSLGHVVGDNILKEFAAVLAHENRAMNIVARFGGDEFVSVLSDGDTKAALGYQARIHQGTLANPLLALHNVTASYGVAEFTPGEALRVEDLIQQADRRMYKKKTTKA